MRLREGLRMSCYARDSLAREQSQRRHLRRLLEDARRVEGTELDQISGKHKRSSASEKVDHFAFVSLARIDHSKAARNGSMASNPTIGPDYSPDARVRAAFFAAAERSAGERFRAAARACLESASFETAV